MGSFCAECGTHVFAAAVWHPGVIYVAPATLDDGGATIEFFEDAVSHVRLADAVPISPCTPTPTGDRCHLGEVPDGRTLEAPAY
mmetsp:Transcript_35720/g.77245  ORF Transcript_35720/g.77245 Transcript_35720/m.77245 type:complete len:84 (+) Transcript_35720:682-933(+)